MGSARLKKCRQIGYIPMEKQPQIYSGEDRFLQIKDWLNIFDSMPVLEIGIGGGTFQGICQGKI